MLIQLCDEKNVVINRSQPLNIILVASYVLLSRPFVFNVLSLDKSINRMVKYILQVQNVSYVLKVFMEMPLSEVQMLANCASVL